MNVFLDMLGCRLNEAEIQSWARHFVRAGHRVVPSAREADLIVLNTCAVTGEAERKSRQHARRLHRESPRARIVLTGCFAELDRRRAGALPGVDAVVPNADKPRLVELLTEQFASDGVVPGAMPEAATEPGDPHVYLSACTRAFVKVQDGCRHRCTFCIVTVARGEERSRPIVEILEEIEELGRAGHREVVITGVHLGGYGSDLGTSLTELVHAVLSHTSIPRVRLSSLEPWDLPPGFFRHWENPRLMPHLHLPLQSGCDRVLRRMGRRCNVADFRALVNDARRSIPALTVTTDVIVGFPGETEADFEASLDTLEDVGFGHVHLFTYSPRAGTGAARQPQQVPVAVKRERMTRARDLAARMAAEHRKSHVGDVREVLWENAVEPATSASSGTPDGGTLLWRGHTDNYLRVSAEAPGDESLRNQIEPVQLMSLDGETISGERLLALPR